MSYEPLVSIVIPAYKAANYLAEAIDCSLAQTYQNIEIIVVNDGSPDDGATREVALRYGDKIRYFEKENGGSSTALNYGIRQMRGEWFSWLSHDDLYHPEKVQRQVEFLQKVVENGDKPEGYVLFTASDLIDKDGAVIRRSNPEEQTVRAEQINGMADNRWLIADQIKKYSFHGCGCFVHKSVLEELGGFDESLRLVNDIDLWLRIFMGGYKVRYLPQSLVQGRIHAKQISRSIGFSYHNPEQDRYWKQVYDYLTAHEEFEDWRELLLAYASTAVMKTRWEDGKRAFALLKQRYPESKLSLKMKETVCLMKSIVWATAKKVYLKVFVRT